MSTPPPTDKKKSLKLNPAIIRAIKFAQLEVEAKGEPVPTIQEAVETAVTEWLKANHPEALEPGRGRPRKRLPKNPKKP